MWFSNGDPFLMIPAALFGWLFTTLGWIWAPGLSKSARAVWIVASALIFAGATGILYWHAHPDALQSTISPARNPLDDTVRLECEKTLSSVPYPASGRIAVLETFSPAGGMEPEITMPGTPGAPFRNNGDETLICRMQNFSDTAIVNAEADIVVQYWTVVPHPHGGITEGRLIGTNIWTSPRVPLGKGETVVFYAWNVGPNFVHLVLPRQARLEPAGSAVWQRTMLAPPFFGGFVLGPAAPQLPPHKGSSPPLPNTRNSSSPRAPTTNICSGNKQSGSGNEQTNICH